MECLIKITSLMEQIEIYAKEGTNVLLFNGKKIQSAKVDKFISDVSVIVASWKEKYNESSIIDGESFFVAIKENGKTKQYSGCNSFPNNYAELANLIREVEKWA